MQQCFFQLSEISADSGNISSNFDDEIRVIYTYYGKAFDNVDHGILLEKLYTIGFRAKLQIVTLILSQRNTACEI